LVRVRFVLGRGGVRVRFVLGKGGVRVRFVLGRGGVRVRFVLGKGGEGRRRRGRAGHVRLREEEQLGAARDHDRVLKVRDAAQHVALGRRARPAAFGPDAALGEYLQTVHRDSGVEQQTPSSALLSSVRARAAHARLRRGRVGGAADPTEPPPGVGHALGGAAAGRGARGAGRVEPSLHPAECPTSERLAPRRDGGSS
jgi:hypothetical protein